jgi:hypothetical protein
MQKTNIIPLNNIPQPWRDTIGRLQNKVVVLPSEPSEDEQMNLWRVGIILDIALHWLVRNELNTQHKIPYSRKLTKVLEPLGLLMTCYLRLCRKAYEHSKAGTLRMEDGKLLIQQGRGRGRTRIPIRTDFLERLHSEDFSF